MFIHAASPEDTSFREAFEAGRVSPDDFDHVAHLRLAYVYLVEGGVEQAEQRMRRALLAFLAANQVPAAKFHETLTRAWLRAVRHFMNRQESSSFAAFIAHGRPLLESRVMLTHYSPETLFSSAAREGFVAPDLEPIPF